MTNTALEAFVVSTYKVVAEVLAFRLKTRLPYLVSSEQSAFVEGIQILDNILLVHEVVNQLRVWKRKGCLGMNKAYDRVG